MSPALYARVAGALAGQAVGDALGAPADGLSAYDVSIRFQKIDDYFGGRGRFSLATRLGYGLAFAFRKGPTPEASQKAHEQVLVKIPSESIDDWVRLGIVADPKLPMLSRGHATSVGVEIVAKLCPLGAWAATVDDMDDNKLLMACKLAALPTHAFRPSILSSFVVVKIIKEVIRNHDAYSRSTDLFEKEGSLLHQVIEFCRGVEGKLPPEEMNAGSIAERLAYVRARLQGRCRPVEFATLNGHSRDVLEMVSFSVFCFMNRPEEFKAVIESIGFGGKAVVRGAILGAMIGAFTGVRDIPPALVRDVDGSNMVLALAKELTDREER